MERGIRPDKSDVCPWYSASKESITKQKGEGPGGTNEEFVKNWPTGLGQNQSERDPSTGKKEGRKKAHKKEGRGRKNKSKERKKGFI